MKPNDIPDFIARALEASGLFGSSAAAPARRDTLPPAPASAALLLLEPLGAFVEETFESAAGSRNYKLYVPQRTADRPLPLVLMLHGCKQDPEDFAVATRMNALAETHGFLVAYPEQTFRSNGANCWNWFESGQQVREGQEPSILAGIALAIAGRYAVDTTRIFVAGLSAGASMAVILGQAYPDVFAGVAAHSGLARGAAHDMSSAFDAMQGRTRVDGRSRASRAETAVRTLVIHGDADSTVHVDNGRAVTRQAVSAFKRAGISLARGPKRTPAVTEFRDASGRVMVRECIVSGGAHAWLGGSEKGSFTEPAGIDASAEVVRFFLAS
ncbi:PHB depolymerase family esterase [Pseudorhodoferax sp. Leaf267]|uniref:extracellular catalytic domain type 1 short-chain-length polyhydroxyalkanoate depolymerase n=1 Tax=Pseudorhodoferax sp. Leaf267 TaxID=1736316 RepID=UPI0006F59CC5|nr:PHB depolymerase family esterase [Pseudorhodoferax sp. Leaf267]KQP18055.1 hypothetical protein ASF43_09385 [Pseudorhodoferax sp. Leaf267]